MPKPLDYLDPKTKIGRSPTWLSQLKVVVKENLITTCCAAVIIFANAVVGIAAVFAPYHAPLILLPPIDFLLVGISVLLTPFVWRNSDETCQYDLTRYLLLAIHAAVSIVLPYLCYSAALSLNRWIGDS